MCRQRLSWAYADLYPMQVVVCHMRVATYSQATAPTRGSLAALGILILTILLGTGVLPTLVDHFVGPYEREITYVWLLVYGLSFLGLMISQGINWVSWLVRYRLLLVILIIGTIVSVSWSVDTKISAERTIHLVGSTLVAIYIGFTVPLLTTLRVFAVVLGIAIIASVLAAVGIAELGIQTYEGSLVWKGVFNSKNDLGFWAAAGVLLYITLSDSTNSNGLRLLCFLLAGICLAVLGLSQSATSLLAMLIAGSLSLYLFIANRFQLGFIRMAFMAVLFTALVAVAVINIDTAELVGRTDDLTGRGEVWRQTWKIIMDKPLTGYGYGAIWFPNDATIWIQQSLTDFTWIVFHAHNGFLQVASEVGLPLSIIALLMVVQQMIEIFYCQYERQQVGVLFVLAFVVAFLISNFSEARFLVTRELFWIFFLALPISMLRQINLNSLTGHESTDDLDGGSPEGRFAEAAYASAVVPGKPWLTPQAGVAAASSAHGSMAGSAPGHTPLLGHQDQEFGDETFDITSGTMALTDADIDLGDDADMNTMDESVVDIEVGSLEGNSSSTGSPTHQNLSEAIDEFDDKALDRYESETQELHSSSDLVVIERAKDIDDADVIIDQNDITGADDRYNKTMGTEIDEFDDMLDESGNWDDMSQVGDLTRP